MTITSVYWATKWTVHRGGETNVVKLQNDPSPPAGLELTTKHISWKFRLFIFMYRDFESNKGTSIYYVRKISRILDPLPPSFAISRNLFFSATILRNGTGYLVVFQIFNITPRGGYWTLILASLEWGQAPKPPSFVALRATTQSTRWSLL